MDSAGADCTHVEPVDGLALSRPALTRPLRRVPSPSTTQTIETNREAGHAEVRASSGALWKCRSCRRLWTACGRPLARPPSSAGLHPPTTCPQAPWTTRRTGSSGLSTATWKTPRTGSSGFSTFPQRLLLLLPSFSFYFWAFGPTRLALWASPGSAPTHASWSNAHLCLVGRLRTPLDGTHIWWRRLVNPSDRLLVDPQRTPARYRPAPHPRSSTCAADSLSG